LFSETALYKWDLSNESDLLLIVTSLPGFGSARNQETAFVELELSDSAAGFSCFSVYS